MRTANPSCVDCGAPLGWRQLSQLRWIRRCQACSPWPLTEVEKPFNGRREALMDRIRNLRPVQLAELGKRWPEGVATFREAAFHPQPQLNRIESAIAGAEKAVLRTA